MGEPDFITPQYIQDAAKAAIDSKKFFSYPPVAGYKDLRESLARKFQIENNISCTYENIVVSNGAKQSLTNVLECLVNPGDEVIVFAPYWVSYAANIALVGGKLVAALGKHKEGFELPIEDVEKLITEKTKLIMYASPSNPSGHVLSEKYLSELAKMLQRYPNVFVLADEIYEHLTFYDKTFSIASIPEIADRVITINGMSKAFAMTGWRIGYMCANIHIANACIKLQGQTTTGPCGISQRASYAALQGGKEEIEIMKKCYISRLATTKKFFEENTRMNIVEPKGAFYLFCSIESYIGKLTAEGKKILNATDMSFYILEEAQTALVAGDGFGVPNYIRISCAASDENLEMAQKNIVAALSKLK